MRVLLLGLLLPLAFAAGGCSTTLDCTAVCDKAVTCDSSQKRDECDKNCGKLNEVSNSDYLVAIDECQSKSCNEITACVSAASQSCTTSLDPFFDRYCEKLVTCQAGLTVELCKATANALAASVLKPAKCLNDGTLSDLATCVEGATCANVNTEMQKCMEQIFDFGASDAPQ